MRRLLPLLLMAPLPLIVLAAHDPARAPRVALQSAPVAPAREIIAISRPRYDLNLRVNYGLLTFSSDARVTIPVRAGDAMRDVVFFLHANADGVGGSTREHPNIQVGSVTLNGAKIPFSLDGAVLRASLPNVQTQPFTLQIKTRGVVPRAPETAGGLMDMLGGADLGSLLGGAATPPGTKKQNADYGLYTFGNGVMSLGSFWYPALAVRQNGQWMDEAPQGLGDVGFSEMSDFAVSLDVTNDPARTVQVAATGEGLPVSRAGALGAHLFDFHARNVRDFAILMSRDWVIKSKSFDVGGKQVRVSAYTLKKDAIKSEQSLDVAGRALQIYAKRFGPYLYDEFKVVQGPIRGGAGGMEFSGMTSIASALYGDLGKQLGELAGSLGGSLGAGGNGASDAQSKALQDLLGDDAGTGAQAATPGENPANDLLNGILGSQKETLDSIFEATIAHEVGHQWWAMKVGSDSLRAPWLDEALTNYTSMLYFEDRYGVQKASAMRDLHLKQTYATARMMGAPDAPANARTSAYSNNLQYGAVIYGKGALFYDALRREIGDAAFFGALRDYADDKSGKLASATDLLKHFATRAPAKKARIQALYQRWITQAHGDEDVTGGKVASINDLLGGLLGGGMGGDN